MEVPIPASLYALIIKAKNTRDEENVQDVLTQASRNLIMNTVNLIVALGQIGIDEKFNFTDAYALLDDAMWLHKDTYNAIHIDTHPDDEVPLLIGKRPSGLN